MTRLLLALMLSSTALAAEPTIEELLVATDDVQRGESSSAVMKMEVKTNRYERAMKMKALSKGTENSLIVILEPAKDNGVSTLKVGDNLWNYLPKVDRTMKVPSGMMGGSWMGSHFSNDDLVKESRLSEDFTASFTAKPTEAAPDQPYVIELVPKPNAPVVWGKVEVTVTKDKLPVSVRYFDEKNTLMRTMDFKDVQDVAGRKVPMTMQLTPADKPGEFTRITYEELAFDIDLPDKTFTVQALKGR